MFKTTESTNHDFDYMNIETPANDQHLEYNFMWMKWLFYFAAGSCNMDKTKRNPLCSCFNIFFISLGILYHLVIISWWLLYGSYVATENKTLIWQIVSVSFEISSSIVRLISLFYLYKHFNQPYKTYVNGFYDISINEYKAIIKKWNIVLKITLIIFVFSDLLELHSHLSSNLSESNHILRITSIFAQCAGRVFVYWPLTFCVYLSCCIFIKYYLYMLKLLQIVSEGHQNVNIDFDSLFIKYKAITKAFKIDFHFYLRLSVVTYLFLCGVELWMDISFQNWTLWGIIASFISDLLPILLYLITAALITATFQSFDHLLWRYCEEATKQDTQCRSESIMLNYTIKYPFVVKIGNLWISKTNVAKFAIIFTLSKVIAYLFSLHRL